MNPIDGIPEPLLVCRQRLEQLQRPPTDGVSANVQFRCADFRGGFRRVAIRGVDALPAMLKRAEMGLGGAYSRKPGSLSAAAVAAAEAIAHSKIAFLTRLAILFPLRLCGVESYPTVVCLHKIGGEQAGTAQIAVFFASFRES